MDVLKKFAADREKVEDGVWVDLGDGLEVRIARFRSGRYRSALAAEYAPVAGRDDLTDEEATALQARAMARGMLLDWRGLTVGDDKVPYSPEAALVLLEELDDFREAVSRASRRNDNYTPDDLEAMADRLGNILGGSSSSETE